MADISFHPSLQSHKGHQSVGSGGSFWLPPKMKAESFDASIKKFVATPNAPKSGNSNPTTEVGVLKKNSAFNTLSHSKHQQVRHADKPSIENSNTFMSSEKLLSKEQKPGFKLSQNTPQVSRKITTSSSRGFIPNHSLTMAGTNQSALLFSGHETVSAPFKNTEESKVFVGSFSSGTGNATTEKKHVRNYQAFTDEDSSSLWNRANPLTEDNLIDEIKGLLSDASFHTSYKNGVARFAFSMENGSSVSVRIEQMNDNFQICFICDNKKSLQYLSQKFSSNSLGLNPKGLPSQIHFFRSYKQMDTLLTSNQ